MNEYAHTLIELQMWRETAVLNEGTADEVTQKCFGSMKVIEGGRFVKFFLQNLRKRKFFVVELPKFKRKSHRILS